MRADGGSLRSDLRPPLRLVQGGQGGAGDTRQTDSAAKECVFGLKLASVKPGRTIMNTPVMLRLFAQLAPGERLEFVHRVRIPRRSGPRSYSLDVRATAAAHTRAGSMAAGLADTLRIGFPLAQFARPRLRRTDAGAWAHSAHITLQPVLARSRFPHAHHDQRRVLELDQPFELPSPGTLPGWPLSAPLNEDLGLGGVTEIIVRVHGFHLDPKSCAALDRCRSLLSAGALSLHHADSPREPYGAARGLRQPVLELLDAWLMHPTDGYALDCLVHSSRPLSDAALARIAMDVFGGRKTAVTRSAPHATANSSPFHWAVRPEQDCAGLVPSVPLLPELGLPLHFDPPAGARPGGPGARVARTLSGTASEHIVLPDRMRSRHIACFGATGAGKSTFLMQLVAEDLASASRPGIGVIDPHGDLVESLLRLVPRDRVGDVVLVDVTDPDWCASLNPLAGIRNAPAYAQFVVNQLVELIDVLFEVKDSSGPVTRNHLKMILLMAGHAVDRDGTFLDAMRCLEDTDYADYLVQKSGDRVLKSYWERFRGSRGTEHGFAAWLPYLMTRLAPFCSSPTMRRLLNTPQPTLSITRAAEEGKILLFNLSKAVLGETESRIAGSVVLNQFFWAALARGANRDAKRIPMHLVVDEFQSYSTESMPRLFAEARKFGLCLTTANQSIGQLRNGAGEATVAQSVLANTATKVMFRLGAADLPLLRPYFQPATDEVMATLPDHTALFNVPGDKRPIPGLMARVRVPTTQATRHAAAEEVREVARSWSRPVEAVNAELAKCFDLEPQSLEG